MKRIKIFAIQICIALGILVLAEVFLRIFSPQINKTIFVNGLPLAKRDTAVGYVLNPGSVTRHRFSEFDVTYRINDQGFNQPHAAIADTTINNVLFIGDSYTFGMGTIYDESYVGLIDKMLPDNFATINAGVLGYDTYKELLMLKKLMPVYKPKVVCVQIVANDFQQIGGESFDAAANLADTAIAWDKHQRYRLNLVDFTKRMALYNDKLYLAKAKKQNDKLDEVIVEQLDSVATLISMMSDLCKQFDSELIVFYYPTKYRVIETSFTNDENIAVSSIDAKISSVLRQNEHQYYSPLYEMVADYAKHKKPHHYRLDGHSTVHGNAFLATWLFDKIQPSLVKQQHPTTFQN